MVMPQYSNSSGLALWANALPLAKTNTVANAR
jgi:hypothetical protein